MIGQSNWVADNWVGAVAAIISGLFALASIKAARKSIAAQNRLLKIEEQREQDRISATRKADLVARIVREEPPPGRKAKSYYLVVENLGQSSARNIEISLDDAPLRDHPAILDKTKAIGTLGPHSPFRYNLAPTFSTPAPRKITIDWDDDSGKRGPYETTLM